MNKCIFTGRLTREIELRFLPNGQAVAKTGFATSEKYKDKGTGETKETTMFIDIIVWGKSAEAFNLFCQKGHKIAIIGKLQLEQWNDKDTGQKHSKHTINVESFEFLEPKNSQAKSGQQDEYQAEQIPGVSDSPRVPEIDIQDFEIPF